MRVLWYYINIIIKLKSIKKTTLLFALICLSLILSGCLRINQNTNQSNTDDWHTYQNERYGYEFKYPVKWVEDREDLGREWGNNNLLHIKVDSYGGVEGGQPDVLATVPTNKFLEAENKKFEEGNIIDLIRLDGVNAQLSINYDGPGAILFQEVKFFKNKDLIRIYVILSSMSDENNRDIVLSLRDGKVDIEKVRDDIKSRKVDQSILEIYDDFYGLVETFEFID